MAGYLRSLVEAALRPTPSLRPGLGIRRVPDAGPEFGADVIAVVPPDVPATGPRHTPRGGTGAESIVAAHAPVPAPRQQRRGSRDKRAQAEAVATRAPEGVVAVPAERAAEHRPGVASARRPAGAPDADPVDAPASRPPMRIEPVPAPEPISHGPAARTGGRPAPETARLYPARDRMQPAPAPAGARALPERIGRADTEPAEVHIHIGRIELVSPPAAAPPRQRASRTSKPMSLDAYLKERRGKPG